MYIQCLYTRIQSIKYINRIWRINSKVKKQNLIYENVDRDLFVLLNYKQLKLKKI